MAAATSEHGRRAGLSVRARVIAATILTAVALAVAGLTAYTLERSLIEQRVDDSLRRAGDEFRGLATQGVDPQTGARFAGPRELCTSPCSERY